MSSCNTLLLNPCDDTTVKILDKIIVEDVSEVSEYNGRDSESCGNEECCECLNHQALAQAIKYEYCGD